MTSEVSHRGSIRRSRAILRAAFGALRRNPRLLWFPVLSGLGVLVLGAIGAAVVRLSMVLAHEPVSTLGPLWSMLGDPDPDPESAVVRALSVGGIVMTLGGHVLLVHMGVAMTHAALEALAGRPWTLRQSLAVASRRRRAIVTFALVQATVGLVLQGGRRRDRRGRRSRPGILTRLARVAWWAATYLVLPVIAREGRGGIRAIERSATLLKETWRETLVARLTMGWLWIPMVIIAAVPTMACAVLGVREPGVLVVVVGLSLLGLAAFGLLLRTLDGIYRAALYSFAVEGVVPEAFAGEGLDEIWEARGGTDEVIDTSAVEPEPDDE